MAMNYTEAGTLQTNSWFKDRVRIATSVYSNYLLNTPTDDPQFDAKQSVATRIAQQYEMVVNQLLFTLSGDSEVQTAGPAIPDSQLQQIVEKTIVKFYPIQSPPAMGTFSPQYLQPRTQ